MMAATLEERMEITINTLRVMGHDAKANAIQEYMLASMEEIERLTNIFKKLDKMYQENTPKNQWGMLDSPKSLQINTRNAINAALNIE